jgi:hypothetical protein
MDEVEEHDIDYVWDPYVALGKLCLLDGDPGSGKTGLVGLLAAAMSRGYPMPDQTGKVTSPTGEPGTVLMVAMEDDLADTLKKRLRLAEATMSRIKVLDHIVTAEGRRQHFTLEHLPLLEEEVQRYGPKLVYIDSLQLVLGPKVDINRANQVMDVMDGLIELAARYHFALICTRHPCKPGQNIGRLIHRGMGSQAFMGRARLGLYVEEYPGDLTKSLLVQSKSNGGAHGITQIFSKAGGHFEWCGATRVTKEILAGQGKGPTPQAFLEACLWLEHRMGEYGTYYAGTDMQKEAKEEGIGQNTLFAAKKALGITHTKSPTKDGGYLWRLRPLSPLSALTPSHTSTTFTTSTTITSSEKTTTYEEGVESGEAVEAVEAVEVVRVVTEAPHPCPCGHAGTTCERDGDGTVLVLCGRCKKILQVQQPTP